MYIGIDIGGTYLKYGLFDSDGKCWHKDQAPTPTYLSDLKQLLVSQIQQYQQTADIQGVGISAPGIIQANGTFTTAGAIDYLYGVNLAEFLSGVFAFPVVIENDANAAALAEQWQGTAKNEQNVIFVVLGTGIGGAMLINGQLYRGSHGAAGEFGWMITQQFATWQCPLERGSWNQQAAVGLGLCAHYNALKQAQNPQHAPIDSARIIFEREASDNEAKVALEHFYQQLALGLLNLMALFDPGLIVIGGGISQNPIFFNRLLTAVEQERQRHNSIAKLDSAHLPQIVPAALRNDAGMVGAIYLLQQRGNHHACEI